MGTAPYGVGAARDIKGGGTLSHGAPYGPIVVQTEGVHTSTNLLVSPSELATRDVATYTINFFPEAVSRTGTSGRRSKTSAMEYIDHAVLRVQALQAFLHLPPLPKRVQELLVDPAHPNSDGNDESEASVVLVVGDIMVHPLAADLCLMGRGRGFDRAGNGAGGYEYFGRG